jgi:hypothetical protein
VSFSANLTLKGGLFAMKKKGFSRALNITGNENTGFVPEKSS